MKIRIIIILILVFTFRAGYAQNTELKNLIVRSFTFNSKVKELDQSTEIAENRIEISRLGLLPAVSGSGSYNYINRVFTIGGNKIQPNNAFNFNVGINYVAFDFGLVKANINKTRQELQLYKDNAEVLKSDLAYQIGNLYYDIVYIKNAISIQHSVLRFLRVWAKVMAVSLTSQICQAIRRLY